MQTSEEMKEKYITIALPEMYEGMQKAKIEFWHHQEESTFREQEKHFWRDEKIREEFSKPIDVIEPGAHFVRVSTARRVFDIQLPPWITMRCRVVEVLKHPGEEVAVGENLIILEPLEKN
jgi:hypothetical protein